MEEQKNSVFMKTNGNAVILRSNNYNFNFNKTTGYFERWGKTEKDDPQFSPFGPEIADIEIGTLCHGCHNTPCSWCYKSNNSVTGEVMTEEKFRQVLDCLPLTVTQIAFGLGDIDSNPDLGRIFKRCHQRGIVPNITINGDRLTDYYIGMLQDNCGAVAVSRYPHNKDLCYNAVEKLSQRMNQINIHCLLSNETYDVCKEVAADQVFDSRLNGMNAIVYLALKKKGVRNNLTSLSYEKYADFVKSLLMYKVKFGFDSCSANAFINAVKGTEHGEELVQMAEPCESTCFSIYVDVHGDVYPCSFCAGEMSGEPIKKGFWKSEKLNLFRGILLANKRSCPIYDVLSGPEAVSELQ